AIAGAITMVSIATRDWQGALAEVRGMEAARNRQWDEAIAHAAFASEDRLWTEGRLSALYLAIQASASGAQDPIRQLEAMLTRLRRGERIASPVKLAQEDAENFERFFGGAVGLTQQILSVIPRYP